MCVALLEKVGAGSARSNRGPFSHKTITATLKWHVMYHFDHCFLFEMKQNNGFISNSARNMQIFVLCVLG